MKKILIKIGLLLCLQGFAQNDYETYFFKDSISTMMRMPGVLSSDTIRSKNGVFFPTHGVYRALTIAVNIIYDQTPALNPEQSTEGAWPYTIVEGINNNQPDYLLELFDVENLPPFNGIMTRLYAESSFNNLILLSDFMVVNIKQSRITPNGPSNFNYYQLMDAVILYINDNGGMNAIYKNNRGTDTIADYDFTHVFGYGTTNPYLPDGRIDIVNFLFRNSTINHGGLKRDSGRGNAYPNKQLIIGQQSYGYNTGTCQCVGSRNIAVLKKNILTHEYAHFFLGGNEFHTSGSVTHNDPYISTFMGKQRGYGLFDGGLLSCNGYERWRLGWYGGTNNAYEIASNNENSNILSKFTGEKTFTLRDFVTYGDVIRIKLPYKESEFASNQYIWLENHQSGKNGKLDEPIFSQTGSCRDVTQAGIYSYYQVGKDVLHDVTWTSSKVFPTNEKDNLKIISANGNYNINYLGRVQDCLGFAPANDLRPQYEYLSSNPFQGSNDQTHVFPIDLSQPQISFNEKIQIVGSKVVDGDIINNLPYLGLRSDAFIPSANGVVMDISSNPSAINTLTYYTNQGYTYSKKDASRDTRKLYLTGLSIKMIDSDSTNTGMKAYTVKIRWDDYDVKQDVYWTGDIVLKEQLNLLSGKKIVLEQNLTPSQIEKDAISGVFSKTTSFSCEPNSEMNLESNSELRLKDKSSFIMYENSSLALQEKAVFVIESGSTLYLKSGSQLELNGHSRIIVRSGAYICMEAGANINLQGFNSLIVLEEGAIIGANPLLFPNANCSDLITAGAGSIVDYSQDVYIQDETISSDRYIGGKNIYVGRNVTASKPEGDVVIDNTSTVIFDCKNLNISIGFECKPNSKIETIIRN